MADSTIRCPNCGTEIEISEALGAQLRSEIEARLHGDYEQRLKQAIETAESRARDASSLELKDLHARLREREQKIYEAENQQLELRRKTRELEELNRTTAERVRAEVEAAAREGARRDAELEVKNLREAVAERDRKVRQAQEAELLLRKEKTALEERQRELDLEVARRLDAEKQQLEAAIRKSVSDEQDLKLKEREKTIADLKKALDDAKRRSELGSQELQGEVLELDLESALAARFPEDGFRPVAKGTRGADLLQIVRNSSLRDCGSIIWESKNTKHFQPAWIEKLKDDQRAAGASLAVLVSVALPDGIRAFGQTDGVWVTGLDTYPALAVALRQQLIQVSFARSAAEGMGDKMELLYNYLAGDEFRHRIEAIVETFTAMEAQLQRERRAMEKLWTERNKQIERVIANTSGLYGDLRGLIGSSMAEIPALELDKSDRDGDQFA